jgi:tetratricopeptide (TPR) repeat protein
MPKPALKADELGNQLLDMLMQERKLSEMSFYAILRDIDKLNDNSAGDYLKALANAIYGRRDEAVSYFDKAMRHGDEVYDINYLIYLHDKGLVRKAVEVADLIGDKYISLILCLHAFETNLFLGKIDSALKYSSRYIKMAEPKDAQVMRDNASKAYSRINYFKELSGFNDNDFQLLSSLAVDVLEGKELKPRAMRFCVVKEENVNAYIISLPTNDAELISEINFEIAMKMAEHDSLLGKNFSFWFESEEEDLEAVIHAC